MFERIVQASVDNRKLFDMNKAQKGTRQGRTGAGQVLRGSERGVFLPS